MAASPVGQVQLDLSSAKAVDPPTAPVSPSPPPPPPSIPAQVDVKDAKEVEPKPAPSFPAPYLQRAGVQLANRVLTLIGTLAVIWLILLGTSEFETPTAEAAAALRITEYAIQHSSAASSPETLEKANQLIGRLNDARRASRDFWTAIGQLLLLNLLLPVLTAILGYIFGTMKSDAGAKEQQGGQG